MVRPWRASHPGIGRGLRLGKAGVRVWKAKKFLVVASRGFAAWLVLCVGGWGSARGRRGGLARRGEDRAGRIARVHA